MILMPRVQKFLKRDFPDPLVQRFDSRDSLDRLRPTPIHVRDQARDRPSMPRDDNNFPMLDVVKQ
ncbi:MAG: hypothetical protein QOF90_1565, partial [Acetobacteraceae bacterium]|nr:hypothetical protein [Acetobacteraceae bacterium]